MSDKRSLTALAALMFATGLIASSLAMAADVPLVVPDDTTIPAGPEGDAICLGRQLMNDTRKSLPRNVGNGLDCSSCHIANTTMGSETFRFLALSNLAVFSG